MALPVHEALGHRFTLAADDPDLLTYLATAYESLRAPTPGTAVAYEITGGGDRYALLRDGEQVGAGSAAYAAGLLSWKINQDVVAAGVQTHVLLHAAAAYRDGVLVVLPAPMESGKTTTVTGLLRAGWSYVTDEAVAVDPETLRVTPFPKPLNLDRGSWPVLPDLAPADSRFALEGALVPVAAAAPGIASDPGAPTVLLTPRYQAGAVTAWEPLSPAEMLMTLAGSTFEFLRTPERCLDVEHRLVDAAASLGRLTIGSLDLAVAAVEDLAAGLRTADAR